MQCGHTETVRAKMVLLTFEKRGIFGVVRDLGSYANSYVFGIVDMLRMVD